jgi:hypothetical protein
MTPSQDEVAIGYPDFFPVMLKKHAKFFDVMQTISPMMDDVFSKGHSEPMHKVCRHLAKVVANSMNAVLLLGMNGIGTDALKIVRSMFEAAVTVAYLRQQPQEFDDYFNFHFIVAKKRLRFMEKYAPTGLAKMSPKLIADNEAGYARVKARYEKPNGKVRGRWSKKDFGAICAELGLEGHYLSFYDLTSRIIHADISGVMAQGDREPGVLDVEISPSDQNVELALRSAHCYLVLAVSQYIALARPDKQETADRLDKDFVAVWKNT